MRLNQLILGESFQTRDTYLLNAVRTSSSVESQKDIPWILGGLQNMHFTIYGTFFPDSPPCLVVSVCFFKYSTFSENILQMGNQHQ